MWRDPKQYKCIRPWFKFNNDLFKVHCVRLCCLLYYHGLLRGLFYASTPLCAFSFKQHFNFLPYHDSEIKIVGNAEHFTWMPERNELKYRVRSNLQNHKKLFCFHFLFQYYDDNPILLLTRPQSIVLQDTSPCPEEKPHTILQAYIFIATGNMIIKS